MYSDFCKGPCWLLEFESGFKAIYSDGMYKSKSENKDSLGTKILKRTFYENVVECEKENGKPDKYGFLFKGGNY